MLNMFYTWLFAIAAAEGSAVNVSEIITTIKGAFSDFNVTNLLLFITAGIGIAAALVLAWFGVRFLTRKLMGALKKGRL